MKEIVDILKRWSPPDAPPFEPAGFSYIEDLEEASQGPLPEAYREFLDTMGNGTGALEVGEAEMRLDNILERYEIVSWTPPPRLVCIGLDRQMLGRESYYLDRKRPWGTDDCAVIRFPYDDDGQWEERARTDFVSFRELILYWGFRSLRAPQLGHVSRLFCRDFLDHADPVHKKIIDTVEHWPVKLLPYSKICRVYDGDHLAAVIRRDTEKRDTDYLFVAAKTQDELRLRVAELQELGMIER